MYSKILRFDSKTPADETYDLHDAGLDFDAFDIPVWVSISYWVSTPDAAAGAYSLSLEWVDPTGATRVVNGTPISLADGSSFTYVDVFPIQRLSSSSMVQMVADLSGSAGSAVVSGRVRFTADTYESINFSDW